MESDRGVVLRDADELRVLPMLSFGATASLFNGFSFTDFTSDSSDTEGTTFAALPPAIGLLSFCLPSSAS
jgi:hypothetical protein